VTLSSSTGSLTFSRTDVPAYSRILQLPQSIVTAAVYRGFRSSLAALPLTFRHRAGVSPYTSSSEFAEACVFVKQSPPPGLCPPPLLAQERGPLLPKLRGHFAEFLQHHSLKRLGMLYQSTCVGLGYGLDCRCCFPEVPGRPSNPIRRDDFRPSSHSGRRRNINPLPIGYGSRPRLRGPANPARINLAQEPLDFRRQRFSRCLSLLMSAFALPIPPACLAADLRRPTERSATAFRRQGSGIRDQNCGG
jgi:hypothetical protein